MYCDVLQVAHIVSSLRRAMKVFILQAMSQQELWQWVHYNYGEDLGLTSDDDTDYVSMSAVDRIQFQMRVQREEKLSQQNVDSVTQPVDVTANKVISLPYLHTSNAVNEIVLVMVDWQIMNICHSFHWGDQWA